MRLQEEEKQLDIHNDNEETQLVAWIELNKSTTGTLLEFMQLCYFKNVD